MPVETPERLLTPTPDLGGTYEGGFNLNDTIVFAKPLDRISPTPEPQAIEISPSLPIDSPLEKAGFLLHRQMINFINTVSEGKIEEAVTELIIEIRAHANEYTREAPLLVGIVKKTEAGMVNKHNNEPVINHLDWTEREGATARGSVDLNTRVLEAKKGDSGVLVSPLGWNGKYPDYEKTQIVFVSDKGEDLDQLTFVLHFRLENCISLLEKMGVSRADLVCADRRQTIKKMVSGAISLDGELDIASPLGFLRLLKGVNPYDPNLKVIERDLERHLRGEDISILTPECEGYLQELEAFLYQNADKLRDFDVQAEYSDRVEETIYKIAAYIRGYGRIPEQARMQLAASGDVPAVVYQLKDSWRDKYKEVIAVLQEISGCAGGGSRSIKALAGSLSSDLARSNIETRIKSKNSCSSCGKISVELECGVCSDCV